MAPPFLFPLSQWPMAHISPYLDGPTLPVPLISMAHDPHFPLSQWPHLSCFPLSQWSHPSCYSYLNCPTLPVTLFSIDPPFRFPLIINTPPHPSCCPISIPHYSCSPYLSVSPNLNGPSFLFLLISVAPPILFPLILLAHPSCFPQF